MGVESDISARPIFSDLVTAKGGIPVEAPTKALTDWWRLNAGSPPDITTGLPDSVAISEPGRLV